MMDPAKRFRRAPRLYLLTPVALVLSCVIAPARARRMVFAHYMVTNQNYQGDTDPTDEAKIAPYEREIQQARSVGVEILH